MKRLQSISKSPVLTHLANTADGLVSVRAARLQPWYLQQFFAFQAGEVRTTLGYFYLQRWSGVRLDGIAAVFLMATAVACLLSTW